MKDWLNAREIASEKLPYMPATIKGVITFAEREGWNAHPTYCRDRKGRGGGLEYHYHLLPTLAQMDYLTRHSRVAAVHTREPANDEAAQSALLTEAGRTARDARLAIVAAYETFATGLTLGQASTLEIFTTKYRMGSLAVDDWVKAAVPSFSKRSLLRWRDAKRKGKAATLAVDRGQSRKGTSVLDTANDGKVRTFLLALVSQNAHFTADHIRTLARDEFGDTITAIKRGKSRTVPMPPVRTFQHFLKGLKAEYKPLLTQLTNPDKYRSTMALAGTGTLRHITTPNDLWQIDASPADVMCTDGRHSIYACTDIATRRTIITVSKTPRASAVCLMIRAAILAWGAPHTIKTDNGSDFTAHETKRLFASLDIKADVSDAYAPQQKGHVERVIKTFQHDLAALLPGFTGHNVTDRKAIEDRKSFAERLGADTEQIFGVELTGTDLQATITEWLDVRYQHRPHAGLKGKTPFQVAAESDAPIRTVDERALDILLMPAPGKNGTRRVTRFGIRIDHYHYVAASILPGTDVFVRRDPADIGRVHAWTLDRGEYLGEAVCAELAGIHPETFYKAEREARAEIMAAQKAELAEALRSIKKGPNFAERVLRVAARDVPNVTVLPKREERHTTPDIEGALELDRHSAPKPLDARQEALHAQIVAEAAGRETGITDNVTPLRTQPTPAQRFQEARRIAAAIAAKEPVDAEDAQWLGSYQTTAEYKTQQALFEEFGDQAPVLRS